MSSNTLYIWDPLRHGLPKTFEEASAILSKLSEGVKDSPNNNIIDFAQRIQDLVRLSPEPDAELLHYYGNFVGVALKHEKALFTVDLPPDQSLEMMRTIVQTANTLPLVVFNDLLGLVFLPQGKILPESRAYMWQEAIDYLNEPQDFPRTKTELRKLAEPLFDVIRLKHGFSKGYVHDSKLPNYIWSKRITPIGEQRITVAYQGEEGGLRMHIIFAMVCDPVNQIYNLFQLPKPSEMFYIMLFDGFLRLSRTELAITNQHELNAKLTLMENIIFPILDKAQDIKGMDELMNGNFDERMTYSAHNLRMYQSLIIARLAGNPQFEELVVKLEKTKGWGEGAYRAEQMKNWPDLVKYLREEVKPLV